MPKKLKYWIGKRPSDGSRWAYTDHATVLDEDRTTESIFRMYRRYVKQWNDIELDRERSLSEHTHQICEASVVGGNRRFILHAHTNQADHWILEIRFSRRFSEFYPGWSCGRNTMRTTKDIGSIRLHWSHQGYKVFTEWLARESHENQMNGEWTEYKH